MIEVGRVCIKIAGRDAKKIAVIVDTLDKNFVLIDGNVRRRKCNIKHLEPLDLVLKIKKGESTDGVLAAMKANKLELEKKPAKKKEKKEKPIKTKKTKTTKEVRKAKPKAKKESKKVKK